MKKGDLIKCSDEKDLRRMLRDLDLGGFHAVQVDTGFWLRITGVPDPEYLVQARDQNGRQQSVYCSTLEEAEEASADLGSAYEFIEILKGYPGEWEAVGEEEDG